MKKFDRVTVLLGVGLILALLAGLSLVAGGVMKLFGFTYDSVGSLVLYFVAAPARILFTDCLRRDTCIPGQNLVG